MTTKPLTTEQIAAALAQRPTAGACDELHRAIDARRAAVRTRLEAISPGPLPDGSADPQALREAHASVQKLVALKQERDELEVEVGMLERLGFRVNEARENALNEAARTQIPLALLRVPAKARSVRTALAALDAAIDDLRTEFAVIGEFPRVGTCPFSDDLLADLLQLRDEVWNVRTISPPNDVRQFSVEPNEIPSVPRIHVPGSNSREDWPKSWPLLFDQQGDVVVIRRGPTPAVRPESHDDTGIRVPGMRRVR